MGLRAAIATVMLSSVGRCTGTELGSLVDRQRVTTTAASDHACPSKQVEVGAEAATAGH